MIDLPPPLEADFVANLDASTVLHVEFQGYRDHQFLDRLFRYQLGLVLQNPGRRVITVAVWTVRPPPSQLADVIERNGVQVRVDAIILPDLPVSRLLANPETVCFAPAADLEGRDALEVCREVARTLTERKADWCELIAAAVAAAIAGRYDQMAIAMKEAEFPVMIEDLVLFGRDQGREEGREEGREQGREEGREQGALEALRAALLEIAVLRKLELTADDRARIQAETSLDRLRAWLSAAAIAERADEVFG